MNKFIKEMMEIGAWEDRAGSETERENAIKEAEELYKKHLAELNLLTIPVVMDCGTCKHQAVSKYVEPCYGCRDNDGYDNFESAIVL